ncbi:3-phosphoserine/phosphohydroxythreonine transaminase [Pseudoalteromonas sp. SG44-1]|jgi:phosphoserine aminotransferase|uniref:3-phosphoserine/phosphohydroxythreonine transaminase n=1 Tax=Pseudoalteromonas TaxID=53246 RepID=UPI001600F0A8|nr:MULTISPECIES: 3-phosphoserine/phosphohydroxythreonine transaminase [Pseudoalteromonas]MBB1299759.1 3-phosphoserine/phosphohydroxythreonine transaminase [Pseudoalteromonas sp. SR44-8]MBB1396488.1 3-phosphoserine/phosphohydroxythreonine transaminase [Pseudoalteromonas sp. SG44-8]MBB1415902.1 3-phosphoserine/phosphohydroxythreonine transaminase [Pseudoalteromonas sp. SG44-1]|tara:strand:+ start:3746 stop:4828 length:1083 start_codon:yes stop_codon:yes gene_type:complete
MSIYNFCAGPAMLPPAVMEKAQKEFLDWQDLGVSVMEISHRSKEFLALTAQCEASLRRLMNISDEFEVLFMHGGGRGQFAAVPLNLHQAGKDAVYCENGVWSKGAVDEAVKFTTVTELDVRNDTNEQFSIKPVSEWQFPADPSYIHYCPNETIDGIEVFDVPSHPTAPIVADMSSTILSREFDVDQFDLIYAGAQKNIGPSGLAIVIIRKTLLEREGVAKPGIFDYALEVKQGSMYNTPPTFAWYLAAEVFDWLEQNGGVKAMEQQNIAKAELLYGFIDESPFYSNKVAKHCRSRMNVPFWLNDESLNAQFLAQAKEAGLLALEGHRIVGGMRASIYNAMPLAGVQALVDFMAKFAKEHS